MTTHYLNWIKERCASDNPFGNCAEWTTDMLAAFPELTRVRGKVLLTNGWVREHWWLTDPCGQIIDPTASQFSQAGSKILYYEPHDESEPEPIGKCANCGDAAVTNTSRT